MALNATVYVFTVRLADADRNVYETLSLRVARHPSESPEFLVTRVLAYCLEFTEGIAFSMGLSDPDEPAIAVRDLTGMLQAWIDVGVPDGARLHKSTKVARRVVVYAHRDVDSWMTRLQAHGIHRAETVEINVIDRDMVAAMAGRLERRMDFDLSVSERHLYLSLGDATYSGTVEARRLAP
jgi:uncharacterized protein YaeQ